MRITRRIAVGVLGALTLATTLAACSNGGSAAKEDTQAQAGINLMLNNQPVPVFPRSAMRAALVTIEAVQALGGPTTSFFMPVGSTGTAVQPIDQCASSGFPIPFGTQLSNPHQVTTIDSATGVDLGGSGNVTDQMDPNGVYVGGNSSGTYVMCLTVTGKQAPRYWEGPVYTVPGTATWNTTSHSAVSTGPDTLPVCTLTGSGSGAHYHCTLPPAAQAQLRGGTG